MCSKLTAHTAHDETIPGFGTITCEGLTRDEARALRDEVREDFFRNGGHQTDYGHMEPGTGGTMPTGNSHDAYEDL